MYIWRMSKYRDLSGRGGLAASGRWHTRPKAIVYCADEPQTAYNETIRQVGHASTIPDGYKLLQIKVPDCLAIPEVLPAALDPRWSDATDGWEICRPVGDRWFTALSSAVLKVPSAARLGSANYLLNTVSGDIGYIEIARVIEQPFPTDLFR